MIQWWVLYRYAALGNFLDGYPEGAIPRVPIHGAASLWEPSIARLMADLTTSGGPCGYCIERQQARCPGMKLHVAVERERAELEAGALVSTAVVELPEGLGWRPALRTVKRLILERKFVHQP